MQTPDLPLESCCEFSSRNFEAMHHRLSAVLKPHRLRRLSNVPVAGVICRANLKRVSFNVLRIGPSVDVWPGALEKFFLVQIPVAGAVHIELGNERMKCEGAMAAVVSPGERLRLRWSDNCTQLIVQIPRDAIGERLLQRRGGGEAASALRFQLAFDTGRAAGREWRELLDFAVRTAETAGAFSREPLCDELEHLLLSALLTAQPHNHADEPTSRIPVPFYVLRAEREMRDHLAHVVTVARLAAAAGVSARTLHEGFRRFRGTTPMARLAAMRLAAARRRLRDTEPGLTVSRAAAEVGISQFGRFARNYRKAYGELPSETLRAARRGYS
jgi:AraC-like DNA-binding protein